MIFTGAYRIGGTWVVGANKLRDFLTCQPEKRVTCLLLWEATRKSAWKTLAVHWLAKAQGTQILWGAPDQESTKKLRRLGIRAELIQPNILCREDIFQPQENQKVWDAIYVGALLAYKRPELAALVPRLRVLARNAKETEPETLLRFHIPHASTNTEWTPRTQVANEINQSHCGLALSQSEGAMLATTEYLLCGIPVVTTPASGGRSLWLTPKNSTTCLPDPYSVAAACHEIKRTGRPQNEIAEETRTELKKQRSQAAQAINHHFGTEVQTEDFHPDRAEFHLVHRFHICPHNLLVNPDPKTTT